MSSPPRQQDDATGQPRQEYVWRADDVGPRRLPPGQPQTVLIKKGEKRLELTLSDDDAKAARWGEQVSADAEAWLARKRAGERLLP